MTFTRGIENISLSYQDRIRGKILDCFASLAMTMGLVMPVFRQLNPEHPD
jgi:hypothetical protein